MTKDPWNIQKNEPLDGAEEHVLRPRICSAISKKKKKICHFLAPFPLEMAKKNEFLLLPVSTIITTYTVKQVVRVPGDSKL